MSMMEGMDAATANVVVGTMLLWCWISNSTLLVAELERSFCN